MEESSASSFSSCPSIRIIDDLAIKITNTAVKFRCSYDGRILPRHSDGKLRYVGGQTRVFSVDRFISYTELQTKLMVLCGWASIVNLRCQLPNDDLDALVSVTTDQDLANVIEEYELAKLLPLKIRAILHPQGFKSPKSPTFPPIPQSTSTRLQTLANDHQVYQRCVNQDFNPPRFHVRPGGVARYVNQGSTHEHQFLINHGNHWR